MSALDLDRVECLCCLWIEERVERLAPVSPPLTILDKTKVPFHVNAAP